MSIEYDIINYLKENEAKGTRDIANAIGVHRYKVVLAISKLLWQQRIELSGYTEHNCSGESHPLYAVTIYRGATIQ